MKDIMDDYGDLWTTGHYTGVFASVVDMVKVYSYYPYYNFFNYDIKDHKEAKQQSYIAFTDMDRNCNTCIHLKRIKHKNEAHGPLYGECTQLVESKYSCNPVKHNDNKISFYAGDWMGMTCYKSRFRTD